jgi:DeoR family suf operon transcriptional repressor
MLVNMLSAAEPSLAGLSVSAREVVLALKKRGEARASEIAEALGITPSGVRQHLSALRADGLVAYRTIHAGPGRPKFAYFLTEPAEALFPKTYHELTNEFLEHLEEEDPELLVRLFERRRQRRVEATRKRLADKTFDEKVAVLARILDEDGYLADFESRPDGTYLIREHNCAILGASPTRSRAPTCAPTKYDLGGDDPEKFQPQDGRPEGPPAPVSPRIGSRWRVECKASTMRMWLLAARYRRPEVRESRSLWQMVESRAVRRG